jgi:hypothetical protein
MHFFRFKSDDQPSNVTGNNFYKLVHERQKLFDFDEILHVCAQIGWVIYHALQMLLPVYAVLYIDRS